MAAIAAIRASFRDKLFSAKAYTTIAAIAALHKKLGLVNESHDYYRKFALEGCIAWCIEQSQIHGERLVSFLYPYRSFTDEIARDAIDPD
jgi:hypothetical protein